MANEYATRAELKSWLTITDTVDDTLLDIALEAASRAIDRQTRRRFFLDGSATARTYFATDNYVCFVDDFDPATAPTVKTDDNDDGTFETSWTVTTDYWLEPANQNAPEASQPQHTIRSTGERLFPIRGRRRQVQVTAKWGFPAVPPAIKEACLVLAEDLFKVKDAPFGAAGLSTLGAVMRIRENPYVSGLIGPYKRILAA